MKLASFAITTLLVTGCGEPEPVPEVVAADARCVPLDCGRFDCGPQLGPAVDHGSDAALGFDIHPGTGNLHLSALDVSVVPAIGSPLHFERHYNSAADAFDHGLGSGWTHTYSWRLSMPDATTARIVSDTGRAIVFTGGPTWTPPAGELGTLTGSAAAGFTYTSKHGTLRRFDTLANLGRLLSIHYPAAATPITIEYASGASISAVTSGAGYGNDRRGSTLRFVASDGAIEAIVDPAGEVTRYRRDAAHRLELVTLPDGGQTSYQWTGGHVSRVQVLQSPGVWVDRGRFWYDGGPGQVTRAGSSLVGGVLHDEVALSYGLCRNVASTTIARFTDGAKTIVSTPVAGVQRTSTITATAGSGTAGESTFQAFTWNADLTPASASIGVGADAITTTFADYDGRGNAGTVIEGAGSPVARTTRYTYHPVLATVLTASRLGVDGATQHVVVNDYDADYDTTYNAAPTNQVRQIVEQGKTDTTLSGQASTTVTYTTTTLYDAHQRPTRLTYPNGKAEAFTYFAGDGSDPDAQFRMASRVVSTSGTDTLVDRILRYDPSGRILETRDPNGVTTTSSYDRVGRVTASVVASGGLTTSHQYAYNLAGQLQVHTRPGGNLVIHEYDEASRRWRTRAEAGDATVTWSEVSGFDDHGRALAFRRFAGLGATDTPTCTDEEASEHCESMTYDAFRRRSSIRTLSSTDRVCRGDDCRLTYTYDSNGNLSCTTEAGLHRTCYQRDGRARLSRVELPSGAASTFGYDINDHLIAMRDPRDPANGGSGGERLSTFMWDDFGRQIARTTLDSGRLVSNFDGAGLRTSTLDARGIRIDTGFDGAGRQISYTVPSDRSGNQDLTYRFDETGAVPGDSDLRYAFSKGRLTSIHGRAVDGAAIVSRRSYDYLGRVVDEVEQRGTSEVVQRYRFGRDGELTSQTYPDGTTVSYQFSSNGSRRQPTSATVPMFGGTEVLFDGASYFADGRLQEVNYANGTVRTVTRNRRGEITRVRAGSGDDPMVDQRFEYDRYGLGRVVAIRNFEGAYNQYVQTQEADELNRPVSATSDVTGAVDSQSWTYDEVGNRTSSTRNGVVTSYHYASNADNRLTSLSGGATEAWTYDPAGFIASHTTPGKRVSYHYDAQQRLHQLVDEESAPGTIGAPASITFSYLATGCGPADISFLINGTVAATAHANAACTCAPGVSTITVTDPAILGLLSDGQNTFAVSFPQYLAWAMATVDGNDFVIYDVAPAGDALARNPDLCGSGYDVPIGSPSVTTPSLGSVTFTWLATACGSTQPISFSINGVVAHAATGAASCSCTPGIESYQTSDPAVLGLLHAGVNTIGVDVPQFLAWAVVTVEDHGDVIVYDPHGQAAARGEDLCTPGYGYDVAVSVSSPSYLPQSTVTFSYDGHGRIWERRLGNGHFTQIYYDAAGRISQEREYAGKTAFGEPVYTIVDHVQLDGAVVAQIVRESRRTALGGAYATFDDDVRVVTHDARDPIAIDGTRRQGLTWGTNTDLFGNWSNLGLRRGTDGKAPTRDDLAMTFANLTGRDISRNDPLDGLIVGLDHGSRFKQTVTERFGGPQLSGFDASSYTPNVRSAALGAIGGFHVPSKGNGPQFNGRRRDPSLVSAEDPPLSAPPLVTVEDSETKDSDVPASDPDEWAPFPDSSSDTPTNVPLTPSGTTVTPTVPLTPGATSTEGPNLMDQVGRVVHDRTNVTVGPCSFGVGGPGVQLQCGGGYRDPGSKQMCAPDAYSEACGNDTSAVTSGATPRRKGDWISQPINPNVTRAGDLTLPNPKEPGVLDPVEPPSPFVDPRLSGGAMAGATCGNSSMVCGSK